MANTLLQNTYLYLRHILHPNKDANLRSVLFLSTINFCLTIYILYILLMGMVPHQLTDFIQYWSSYRLFRTGHNPYEPELMLSIQQQAFPQTTLPTMMWNPPWVLLFMSPFLGGLLAEATKNWLLVSLGLFLAASIISWKTLRTSSETILPIFIGLTFLFPLWNTLWFGQCSSILALASALLYWSLVNRKDFLAGIALAMFTIKPHVIYLVVLVILAQILSERRYKIALGASIALFFLVAGTLFQAPQVVEQWASAMSSSQVGATKRMDWAVATLVGAVRVFSHHWLGTFPLSPIVIIPSITAILTLWLIAKGLVRLDWQTLYHPLACISLFTSPYGWVFDSSMLIPTHMAIFAYIFSAKTLSYGNITLVICYNLLHFTCYIAANYLNSSHHHFFFFPFAMLFFWYCASKLNAQTEL